MRKRTIIGMSFILAITGLTACGKDVDNVPKTEENVAVTTEENDVAETKTEEMGTATEESKTEDVVATTEVETETMESITVNPKEKEIFEQLKKPVAPEYSETLEDGVHYTFLTTKQDFVEYTGGEFDLVHRETTYNSKGWVVEDVRYQGESNVIYHYAYSYNDEGHVVTMIEYATDSPTSTEVTSEVAYRYDGERLVEKVVKDRTVTEYAYNNQGEIITENTYLLSNGTKADLQLSIENTFLPGNSDKVSRTVYRHAVNDGDPVSIFRETRFTYDEQNRLVKEEDYSSFAEWTEGEDLIETSVPCVVKEYDEKGGFDQYLYSEDGERRLASRKEYTEEGNRVEIEYPSDPERHHRMEWIYGPQGELLRALSWNPQGELYSELVLTYDEYGTLLSGDYNQEDKSVWYKQRFNKKGLETYYYREASGQKMIENLYELDEEGDPVSGTLYQDGIRGKVTFRKDADGTITADYEYSNGDMQNRVWDRYGNLWYSLDYMNSGNYNESVSEYQAFTEVAPSDDVNRLP